MVCKMTKPKVLFLDCESLPNICYAYDLYSPKNYKMIIKEKSLITFAWKWLGEKEIHVVKAKEAFKDGDIIEVINGLFEEADYVIAHYGDKFDLKYIRSRALINNLPAPAPVPSIDTYKLAKKYFNFNANRLDYLGELFGLGRKVKTSFELWDRCAKGERKAINEMAAYNVQDVALLEKIFLKMVPHVQTKLNHQLFTEHDDTVCHNCGSKKIQKRGTIISGLTKRQRYCCTKCHSWFSGKIKKEI